MDCSDYSCITRNIYILIMFAKFQNFYTRTATMHRGKVQFQSENCHDTHGHHCNFTAWDPGSKMDWYKRCHCRAKYSFGVQNSSSGKVWFLKFSFIFWPFQINFTFLPPCPILLLPSLYIPISFSQPATWL